MPPSEPPALLTEAPPVPSLAGLAACTWHHAGGAAEHRVLPDGCMDILRRADGSLWLVSAAPAFAVVPALTAAEGLRFRPGALPRLLRLSSCEIGPAPIPLAEAAPWLASAEDLSEVAARLAVRRPDTESNGDRRLRFALRWMRLAGPSVEQAAEVAGLGPRQFRRRCLEATGLAPKALARVLRLQRILPALRNGLPLSALAAAADYADQAHMTRDLRALTGLTPTALTAEVRRVRFLQDTATG